MEYNLSKKKKHYLVKRVGKVELSDGIERNEKKKLIIIIQIVKEITQLAFLSNYIQLIEIEFTRLI